MTSYNVELPFDPNWGALSTLDTAQQPCCCRLVTFVPRTTNQHQYGKCCQGAGGTASHTKSLHWSYDFLLPVGSPVLSARDGVVVAAVDHFHGGGTDAYFKARANYVVIRHVDHLYSRYYHLQPNSLVVTTGDQVQAGDLIGHSGSTGYTTGPHLHFDVVDLCIYSYVSVILKTTTGTLSTKAQSSSSSSSTSGSGSGSGSGRGSGSSTGSSINQTQHQRLYACVASFSGALPHHERPLCGVVRWADPPDATLNPLSNATTMRGTIAVVQRCGKLDFIEKASRAANAGAIGVVIVNNEEGPALHVCATPKQCTQIIHIPVVMVTMEAGNLLQDGKEILISKDPSVVHRQLSPLREKWQKVGNDKEFNAYQPVTVGPVCFRVVGSSGSTAGADVENKEQACEWDDPKTNSYIRGA